MTNQPGKLSKEAKTSMLSIAARAALAGHDLTGFEPFTDIGGNPNGYQAKCRRCGRTGWVGEDGWQYSVRVSGDLFASSTPGSYGQTRANFTGNKSKHAGTRSERDQWQSRIGRL